MEEGIFWLTHPYIARSLRKVRAELKAGAWQSAECCLLACSHALLTVLSYATQDYLPRVAAPVLAWALLKQSLIKKMPYKLARGPSYRGVEPHLRFPFPENSSLCQFVKKQKRNPPPPPSPSTITTAKQQQQQY